LSAGDSDKYVLNDGAHIAVIGGGPAGSFFSIFALKMAKLVDKELNITIFEPKDFNKKGPAGCNRCGGVISELLIQTLAVEGINIPGDVVREGINSYNLHTNQGSVYIATPSLEKTIATVYRGGGPKGVISNNQNNFDSFLLNLAVREGAVHERVRIHRVKRRGEKIELYSKDNIVHEADFIVGAFGVNSSTSQLLEELGFGYKKPDTVTTAVAELKFTRELIKEYFRDSIHLFLLPIKNIKFAIMIPKETYVTLCILGKEINANVVDNLINHEVVRGVLPSTDKYERSCLCLPKMNVKAPLVPFTDRVVSCGDAGSTRLFKDGIGAAYITGKAAAKTAVFHGVCKQHFQEYYYPVYRSIVADNWYGKPLFSVTDLYGRHKIMTKSMLAVVRKEQEDSGSLKTLSTILWDMFTGNEKYKNIFRRSINLKMHINLLGEFAKALSRREQ
jgi:flavin-dependent dehydrogenase